MRLVRAGDEAAFEAIFDRHHRGILSFCRHMVSSREEAEDAVQHTFAAAYRDLVGSDKPIQLKAWLYTIARNRCLSILRARREQVNIEDAEPSTEGLAAEVQRRQDLRDMLADLSRLPEDQRAALVLAELGALSHDEIGVTLGVRKDKVKALVFQARESLSSSRDARDADCQEIQEQLAVLRGGALRRTELKRHIEICPACATFKAEVQRQRAAMACLLPVVPSALLRESVMAAAFGGGAAAGGGALLGGGGGGLLAAVGAKGLAAKVMTIAVVAGGATGGGLMAVDELSTAPADEGRVAIAAAPEEAQSVRLVTTLRERAKRAAEQRSRDTVAARGATPPSGSTPAGGARPASHVTPSTSGGDKPRAEKSKKDLKRNGRPGATPTPTPTPATPVVGPSAAPATPPTATSAPPAPTPAREEDQGRKKPKKPKKPKVNGRRSRAPVVQLPATAGPKQADDDDTDTDGDSDGQRKRRNRGPGKQRKVQPVPQPPQQPQQRDGDGDDKRGRGHDGTPGNGNGHDNHEGDGDKGKDKHEKLVTDLLPPAPVVSRVEAPAPALPPLRPSVES